MNSERSLSFEQALIKLETYCAYQERCSTEILEKANSLGQSQKDSLELLKILQKKQFVDDERFALSFAQGKFRFKSWGRNKIKFELKRKRISDTLIQKALYSLEDESYAETVLDLAVRKWPEVKGKTDYERKAKLFRFLQGKGFESDLISSCLKKLDVK